MVRAGTIKYLAAAYETHWFAKVINFFTMRASHRKNNVAITSHSSLLNANRRPKTIPPAWKPAAGINPKNNKLPIRCSSDPGANAAAIPKNTDITERKLPALKVAKPSSAVCRAFDEQ